MNQDLLDLEQQILMKQQFTYGLKERLTINEEGLDALNSYKNSFKRRDTKFHTNKPNLNQKYQENQPIFLNMGSIFFKTTINKAEKIIETENDDVENKLIELNQELQNDVNLFQLLVSKANN
eukprot:TRINITY_DN10299_c0_g1_i1.p1 TRINITY_DN10299_c0_g1~~TRINITY_DN10299_c0_g1_i1.p1  ORF type:complete len:138 (+),score=41.97 TRINITY_DN10299_c0_g1_i1:51-416(+)